MSKYNIDDRNKVKRVPKRGHYDQETVHAILDETFVCHVGMTGPEGQPYVIPTAFGREGNKIYIHGAVTSRMMKYGGEGLPICITVTHLDGIVLARSAFHHSMNYRSAVCFGSATIVPDDKKVHVLKVISDHILKDRWEESRLPNDKELKATTVLEMEIEQASAKIRTGGPGDDKPDYELDIWAGVIPMKVTYGDLIPDEVLREGIPTAPSALAVTK